MSQPAQDLAGDPERSPARRRRALSWLAAAVVLVMGAALLVLKIAQPPALSYRSEDTDAFGTVTPGSGSVVAAADLIFTWQAVEGADRYQIEATAPTGETLATFEVEGDRLSAHWPEGAPPPPRGRILWKLRATTLDQTVAETRPIPIQVR